MNQPIATRQIFRYFSICVGLLCVCGAQSKLAQSQDTQAQTPDKATLKQRSDDFFNAKTVVFLGDSNTHRGEFIVQIEATLRANDKTFPQLVNLGLPSETCSGLSEPVHPFPRPNVHERLDRVLAKSNPDIVIACYGMNDGIYHPFDAGRFEKFKSGINELITKVNQHGAKLVLITPPPFDAHAMKSKGRLATLDAKEFSWTNVYENYEEEVIDKYATWMMGLEKNEQVYAVIDAHSDIKKFIANKRKDDPRFSFSPDGVHFHMPGHRVLATSILKEFGFNKPTTTDRTLVGLVRERQTISHMSWLSHVGHLRPDVKEGIAFEELPDRLSQADEKIAKHLAEPAKEGVSR